MIDLFLSLSLIYLILGVAVSIYARVVAKTNLAAMLIVTIFWPLFLITGFQTGALGDRSQKRLRH